MFEIDEMKIFRGQDIYINDKIIVTQPTIDEIIEFGEKDYFSSAHTLTSVGADLKWQLWEKGIDYTTIDDFELFKKYLCHILASRKYIYKELTENKDKYKEELKQVSEEDLKKMLKNPLSLILKNIDLADFQEYEIDRSPETILYNPKDDITIDRPTYMLIVDAVRRIHYYKRNNEIPGNEATKMILIEDARDELLLNANKPYKSVLKPLISAMMVKTGQLGNDNIWNTKIHMFLDSIKRAYKIQDAEFLMQGAYSGFASLKDIDKNRLDWTSEI